jgi:hypothetical protein
MAIMFSRLYLLLLDANPQSFELPVAAPERALAGTGTACGPCRQSPRSTGSPPFSMTATRSLAPEPHRETTLTASVSTPRTSAFDRDAVMRVMVCRSPLW